MPPVLRSVFAVMVGFMVMIVLSVATTLLALKAFGVHRDHPSPGYFLYNAMATFAVSLLGGMATGAIAEGHRLRHGFALGMLLLVFGTFSYRHYTGTQPAWYQAMMVVGPAIFATLGAAAAERRERLPAR